MCGGVRPSLRLDQPLYWQIELQIFFLDDIVCLRQLCMLSGVGLGAVGGVELEGLLGGYGGRLGFGPTCCCILGAGHRPSGFSCLFDLQLDDHLPVPDEQQKGKGGSC